MGKISKAKNKGVSVRSRAARRTFPPESVKEVVGNPPETVGDSGMGAKLESLAARHDAGISKKRNKKQLSRKQRERKEKGTARANIVLDQLEKKTGKSKAKGKAIKHRSADWDDLNNKIKGSNKTIKPDAQPAGQQQPEAMAIENPPNAEHTGLGLSDAVFLPGDQLKPLDETNRAGAEDDIG